MGTERSIRRGVGMGARPADRAPVPDLRVADATGDVDEERVAARDDRVLVDLAMGGPRPDPELVVRLDDGVEAADVLQVNEQARLGQPEL